MKIQINYLINYIFNLIHIIKFFMLKIHFYVHNIIKYESKVQSSTNSYSFFEVKTSVISTLNPFNEWLAGVIDGDGYFNLSKKGTARFNLTMGIRDKKALYEIKHKFGGSIYSISNANALIFNNGWFSGIIDSDGFVYFSEKSGQVFISITQKNKYILEPLIHLYGGRIDINSPKREAFKYIVYRKNELFNLIDNYFSKYPLKTKKSSRLHLVKQFFLLHINKDSQDINKYNKWVLFKDKWEKYDD